MIRPPGDDPDVAQVIPLRHRQPTTPPSSPASASGRRLLPPEPAIWDPGLDHNPLLTTRHQRRLARLGVSVRGLAAATRPGRVLVAAGVADRDRAGGRDVDGTAVRSVRRSPSGDVTRRGRPGRRGVSQAGSAHPAPRHRRRWRRARSVQHKPPEWCGPAAGASPTRGCSSLDAGARVRARSRSIRERRRRGDGQFGGGGDPDRSGIDQPAGEFGCVVVGGWRGVRGAATGFWYRRESGRRELS